jgi:hypothetical protein
MNGCARLPKDAGAAVAAPRRLDELPVLSGAEACAGAGSVNSSKAAAQTSAATTAAAARTLCQRLIAA